MRRARISSSAKVEATASRPTKKAKVASAKEEKYQANSSAIVDSNNLNLNNGKKYAVILRGVNVGSGNRIEMAKLRSALEASGFLNVQTLQAAGNIVLQSVLKDETEVAASIKEVLKSKCHLEVPIVLRSFEELKSIIERNPFKNLSDAEPKRLQVAFFHETVSEEAKEGLRVATIEPEKSFVEGREAYLWHAEGIARSKLWEAIAGRKAVPGNATCRNYNTVLKLKEMLK